MRALRKAAGFSFDAFVGETELGRGYVSELERGLVVPTLGTMLRIARALDVTVADLVLGDSNRENLFDLLRNAPDPLVRELLDIVVRRKG